MPLHLRWFFTCLHMLSLVLFRGLSCVCPWVFSFVCLHAGDSTTLVTLQSSLVFPLCSVAVPASLFCRLEFLVLGLVRLSFCLFCGLSSCLLSFCGVVSAPSLVRLCLQTLVTFRWFPRASPFAVSFRRLQVPTCV